MDNTLKIDISVIEKLARISGINGTQCKIIMAVLYHTCGNWSRELSMSTLSNIINCHIKQTYREISPLFKRKILNEIIKPDYVNARVININLNLNEWVMEFEK